MVKLFIMSPNWKQPKSYTHAMECLIILYSNKKERNRVDSCKDGKVGEQVPGHMQIQRF